MFPPATENLIPQGHRNKMPPSKTRGDTARASEYETPRPRIGKWIPREHRNTMPSFNGRTDFAGTSGYDAPLQKKREYREDIGMRYPLPPNRKMDTARTSEHDVLLQRKNEFRGNIGIRCPPRPNRGVDTVGTSEYGLPPLMEKGIPLKHCKMMALPNINWDIMVIVKRAPPTEKGIRWGHRNTILPQKQDGYRENIGTRCSCPMEEQIPRGYRRDIGIRCPHSPLMRKRIPRGYN